jgi:hypothetical protein
VNPIATALAPTRPLHTKPHIDSFWNDSWNVGRLTLFDWMGVTMPVAVLLAVVLALVFSTAAEWLERLMNRDGEVALKSVLRWPMAYGLWLCRCACAHGGGDVCDLETHAS